MTKKSNPRREFLKFLMTYVAKNPKLFETFVVGGPAYREQIVKLMDAMGQADKKPPKSEDVEQACTLFGQKFSAFKKAGLTPQHVEDLVFSSAVHFKVSPVDVLPVIQQRNAKGNYSPLTSQPIPEIEQAGIFDRFFKTGTRKTPYIWRWETRWTGQGVGAVDTSFVLNTLKRLIGRNLINMVRDGNSLVVTGKEWLGSHSVFNRLINKQAKSPVESVTRLMVELPLADITVANSHKRVALIMGTARKVAKPENVLRIQPVVKGSVLLLEIDLKNYAKSLGRIANTVYMAWKKYKD